MRALALGLLAMTLTAVPASAGDDANPVIKYRQLEMEALARHMGSVKMVVKNQVDRKGDVLGHAEAMHALAKDLVSQYPAGTGPDSGAKTEAKAEIWSDAAGFAKAAQDFETATAALVEAAKGDDLEAMAKAFGGVGQACGGCHDTYREDDH